jgi:hypothetical protein
MTLSVELAAINLASAVALGAVIGFERQPGRVKQAQPVWLPRWSLGSAFSAPD